MPYSHTQESHTWLVFTATIEAVILVVLILTDAGIGPIVAVIAVFSLVTVVGILFSRLTVEVDDAAVRLAFRNGRPRKTIPWGEVTSVAKVRNRWWYGFGMRKIPGGWLWNVGGLDAVELRLDTGKVFRVGTDDPEGLLAAASRRAPVGG